ncbi:MAG: nucleotidyltransferase [Bacteroidetes bacterium]|nr:MAG: nucleotidyltransferase [Bacteroidota bacterium]
MQEAIILAGGLGTRLKSVLPDTPKCMAPIAGKPFLDYLIRSLQKKGIEKFIFSLGYKYEIIVEYLEKEFPNLNYKSSIEETPLGTGGAIKLAASLGEGKTLMVANGDTFFDINPGPIEAFHHMCGAHCTLALKPMVNFDRYGVVELNKDYSISAFKEKKFYESGLINGGIYFLNKGKFLDEDLPDQFSFEKDYLEKFAGQRRIFGVAQDVYFIDIGIPEDYIKAQQELPLQIQTNQSK